MPVGILGKKLRMTQIFDEQGNIVPVTVIQAGPCYVIRKKVVERDGYNAIQVGFDEITKVKRVNKPMRGLFKKAGTPPLRFIREFKVDEEELKLFEIGKSYNVADVFKQGMYVDVTGTSKGKGFQGVVKRHGFSGAPASRGTHEYFRHGGSIGQNMTPGRTMKGKKMPGHMGMRKVTVQNLKVVDIKPDLNVMLVKGAIPGPTNGYVIIRKAKKKP
ncbi:MAG: 50S ribosomal protein L3 [Desulfobacterota bacterium]|nr:50S ribosomal protein L3 [Thermodesulfobacteriota bacterium]MDW8001390.1 50S ribosomal protein L3 [Deltaproteobacteria bacterium]